jgi:glycosyltransferase involved in cell wall biosynthesis
MKHIMQGLGLNPLVIPNGIPKGLLTSIDANAAARLRRSVDGDLILTKVARWDPNKRWKMAVEAVARFKTRGIKTVLLAAGGIEPHGQEVMQHARSLGLTIKEARTKGNTFEDYCQALKDANGADIIDIKFRCPLEFLKVVYNVSDAVLANSAHEPFGLVGLETMAAGGIAFTGGTGEDYAIPFHNCIVIETSDPQEIEDYVMYLKAHPAEEERIRRAARKTARLFTWEEVIKNIIQKLEYQARIQELLEVPSAVRASESKPSEYPETGPMRESALTT